MAEYSELSAKIFKAKLAEKYSIIDISSELKDCYIENSNSSSLSSIIMLFFLLSPVLIILYIRWKDKNQRNKK